MQVLIDTVSALYKSWCGEEPTQVEVIPQSGSDRRYFRLYGTGREPVIGTHGLNVAENEAFIYFSGHFHRMGLPVPEVLALSEDKQCYLQKDVGDTSLLSILEEKGFTGEVYALFKESLHQLARLQVLGDKGLNYERCLTNKEFGRQAIKADLFYFKYYFLDALRKPYDKQALGDDFDALSSYLTHTEFKFFMFRDFQSRNIQVASPPGPLSNPAKAGGEGVAGASDSLRMRSPSTAPLERGPGGEVFFIDYQGGMKGAPQYDVASMIWQARANLPDEWKDRLLHDYMDSFETLIDGPLDRAIFQSQYNGYVLIRLLQVLGAYGFRGLFERKAQFLTSIPLALKNLKWFIENNSVGISVPEFKRVLEMCVQDEIIQRFTPVQATDETPLVVRICSFSYRQGIPEDTSGNGGGFVFDMRGIDNPGRHEQYKTEHGRDQSVMEYLERQTRMQDFLVAVFDAVDISVEEYIKRGFAHLSVSFGCTGGQHRSVYAADALARHLKNKFKVKIDLCHVVQEAKGWKNSPLSPA